MTESLATALRGALGDNPFTERFELFAAPLLEQYANALTPEFDPESLRGLALALASQIEVGRHLARRPELLARCLTATPASLELGETPLPADGTDLEQSLDEIRLLRRDQTVLIAALDLADRVPFATVSEHLSRVAEACLGRALTLAERQVDADERPELALVGMGKAAGRELTYRSDLDLIFLYRDGGDATSPARIAQRLIAYLNTPTGTGIAYEIDSRLRPSGRQGTLVSTHEAFARYQLEHGAVWEHLALLRARTLAGDIEAGQESLRSVRRSIAQKTDASLLWREVAMMRERVVAERGRDSKKRIPYKAGAGGLMDVDFLATGALLERGEGELRDALPSVPAMLRQCAAGKTCDTLLEDYGTLRRIESRARWMAGRAVEAIEVGGESTPLLAELVQPGCSPQALVERIMDARSRIADAFEQVTAAGTIAALEG